MTKIFDMEQENYRSIWKQKIAPLIIDNREHAKEKSEKNNDDEKNNNVVWHFVDGSTRKITPFKYMPKRGIADQFMNMNNDIVSTLFACNNNVTSGDKIRFTT